MDPKAAAHLIPAFPHTGEGLGVECAAEGMSLRDYFAAQALQGFIAHGVPINETGCRHLVARNCYSFADAMLAERNK